MVRQALRYRRAEYTRGAGVLGPVYLREETSKGDESMLIETCSSRALMVIWGSAAPHRKVALS